MESGALSAVLAYVDFFPLSVQRVALGIAATVSRSVTASAFFHVESIVPMLTPILLVRACVFASESAPCHIRSCPLCECWFPPPRPPRLPPRAKKRTSSRTQLVLQGPV